MLTQAQYSGPFTQFQAADAREHITISDRIQIKSTAGRAPSTLLPL